MNSQDFIRLDCPFLLLEIMLMRNILYLEARRKWETGMKENSLNICTFGIQKNSIPVLLLHNINVMN